MFEDEVVAIKNNLSEYKCITPLLKMFIKFVLWYMSEPPLIYSVDGLILG